MPLSTPSSDEVCPIGPFYTAAPIEDYASLAAKAPTTRSLTLSFAWLDADEVEARLQLLERCAFPRLETLWLVRAAEAVPLFANTPLPALRCLKAWLCLTQDQWRTLFSAEWMSTVTTLDLESPTIPSQLHHARRCTALEHLILQTYEGDGYQPLTAQDSDALATLPALRILDLQSVELTPGLVHSILRSPLPQQLHELMLSCGDDDRLSKDDKLALLRADWRAEQPRSHLRNLFYDVFFAAFSDGSFSK